MKEIHQFVPILAAILAILVTTQLFARLFTILRLPAVIGEVLGGVVLGPTVLGYFFPAFSSVVFSKDVHFALFVLSNLGICLYMFIVGMEMDFHDFKGKLMKESIILSVSAITVPFALGIIFGAIYFDVFRGNNTNIMQFCVFLGSAMAITAFPVLARILQENNLIKTKLGSLALMSASMQDVISWIFLSYVVATAAGAGTGARQVLYTFLLVMAFLGTNFFIVRPLLVKMMAKLDPDNQFHARKLLRLVIILLIANVLAANLIGLNGLFGGFVTGLMVPKNKALVRFCVSRLEAFGVIFLLPIFFALSGLNTNMLILGKMGVLLPSLIIMIVAFAGKYLSSLFTLKAMGYSWRQSSAVGGLNNARGLMELIIANVGFTYGIITGALYSILVLLAILSTLLAMPIYKASLYKDLSPAIPDEVNGALDHLP
jgi:Kef-type K+ transport system membrane component KefB